MLRDETFSTKVDNVQKDLNEADFCKRKPGKQRNAMLAAFSRSLYSSHRASSGVAGPLNAIMCS